MKTFYVFKNMFGFMHQFAIAASSEYPKEIQPTTLRFASVSEALKAAICTRTEWDTLFLCRVEEITTTTEGREERIVISEQEARVSNCGNILWAVGIDGHFFRAGQAANVEMGERATLYPAVEAAGAAVAEMIRIRQQSGYPIRGVKIVPVRVTKTPGISKTDVKVTELK